MSLYLLRFSIADRAKIMEKMKSWSPPTIQYRSRGSWLRLFCLLVAVLFGPMIFFNACGGQKNEDPPGVLRAKQLPDWLKKYQLDFPSSIAYQDGSRFVLKTAFPLAEIEKYYLDKTSKQNFTLIERLSKPQALLMEFKKDTVVIAVEISKLPYADNHLIRLGHSDIQ